MSAPCGYFPTPPRSTIERLHVLPWYRTRVMISVNAFKTSQSRKLAACDGIRTYTIRRLLDQLESPQRVDDDDGGSPKRLRCPHRVGTFPHLLNRPRSAYISYLCVRTASHNFRQRIQPGCASWRCPHPKQLDAGVTTEFGYTRWEEYG